MRARGLRESRNIHRFGNLQMFLSEVHGLLVVPQSGVGVAQTPAGPPLPDPAVRTNADEATVKTTTCFMNNEPTCCAGYVQAVGREYPQIY